MKTSEMLLDVLSLGLSTPFDVHLQWFAAEDEGRTEEPSEHKLRKAREEGKVAKSTEFSSSLVLLAAIGALGLLGDYVLRSSAEMLRFFLSISATPGAFNRSLLIAFLSWTAKIGLPVLVVAFTAAILGNVIQVGFLFTARPITPDFSRITPRFGRWLSRSFGSPEALFNLAKALIKIVLIAAIAYVNIRSEVPRLTRLAASPFFIGVSVIAQIAFRLLLESAIALLAFSAIDYWFQRRQHIESLKMSRQEVKEERKMYEGDPLTRSRLRERMREIMRRNMLKAVPKADVVITNPTHYAVALEYNRALMPAPTVVAKGADMIAQRIREIAAENSIPIMENKPLAQALYREVEIGDVIPEKFYEVMSTILAEVYRLNNKSAQQFAAEGAEYQAGSTRSAL
ncbi:MAG TPA: flagellar biosynthesis protein FlhB [Spirochaetia bacterium]|nr:flagellar biosynthesis protein FlhB [Spirochaetia bacterium]